MNNIDQIKGDLKALITEHSAIADQELMYALGAPNAKGTKIHTDSAYEHRKIAEMYSRMSEEVASLIYLFG